LKVVEIVDAIFDCGISPVDVTGESFDEGTCSFHVRIKPPEATVRKDDDDE
jgi:hypothetical protein